jgi:prevent-host-death family protein
MKRVSLSQVKAKLSLCLREANREHVIVTRHGRPVGVLIGFTSDDDWLDYLMENHPAVAKRVARAREDIRAGKGIRLEDLDAVLEKEGGS